MGRTRSRKWSRIGARNSRSTLYFIVYLKSNFILIFFIDCNFVVFRIPFPFLAYPSSKFRRQQLFSRAERGVYCFVIDRSACLYLTCFLPVFQRFFNSHKRPFLRTNADNLLSETRSYVRFKTSLIFQKKWICLHQQLGLHPHFRRLLCRKLGWLARR